MILFAHSEAAADSSGGIISGISHQPPAIALAICISTLIVCYFLFSLLKINLLTRLFLLVPVMFGLTLLFYQHNPLVASFLLSGGFIMVFALALLLLGSGK